MRLSVQHQKLHKSILRYKTYYSSYLIYNIKFFFYISLHFLVSLSYLIVHCAVLYYLKTKNCTCSTMCIYLNSYHSYNK